ncbi:UNVERIFIED_CONTAM: hypothetical protein Sindi_2025200 [Sesamum indicum]
MSRSLSIPMSASESASSSDTSSMSGSSATSPRETAGTSRDPASSIPAPHSDLPKETAESDEAPVFQKYNEMMQQKPWLGIVNIIKTTPVQLKRKYYILADYDVIIPRFFDRMHQPPKGYCVLSTLHLDAGLRFPLPRELSPNSISHILLFIIVMKRLDCPPPLIISGHCTISLLFQKIGRNWVVLPNLTYFFLRSPPGKSWDFYLGWRESKPKPETYGEGFESDLVNYITLFWYLPKVLLQEKVLKLAGLSPAPIPVKGSLGDFGSPIPLFLSFLSDPLIDFFAESEIMLAKIANKARAKQGTLPPSIDRELKRAATAAKGISKECAPTPTPSPATATVSDQLTFPIEVRDHTHDEQVEVVEISEDHGLKRKRGKEKATFVAEPTESRSDPSSRAARQDRLEAKLAADRAAEPENRWRFATFQEVWQQIRVEQSTSAGVAEMSGEKWVPDWKISKNSSVLQTLAGQDSWEIYRAACLERDQIILTQTSHTYIEEHFAHNITQAMAFSHNLSLQCLMWRHEKIVAEAKVLEIEKKILEQQSLIESLQSDALEKMELASKLEISKKELEEVRSTAQSDREAAFEAGREQGLTEARARFLQSKEHKDMLDQARMNGARDFLKSRTFREAVENEASEFMIEGFEKC